MATATDKLSNHELEGAQFKADEPFVGLYTMYYRQGSVGNHILTKNFRFNGSLKGARDRAELHCNIIGAKLNFVQPLISNLQLEEKAFLGGGIASSADVPK